MQVIYIYKGMSGSPKSRMDRKIRVGNKLRSIIELIVEYRKKEGKKKKRERIVLASELVGIKQRDTR